MINHKDVHALYEHCLCTSFHDSDIIYIFYIDDSLGRMTSQFPITFKFVCGVQNWEHSNKTYHFVYKIYPLPKYHFH